MNEFKGTKGPWQVGRETIDGDIRIINPDGAMVAMTEVKTGDGYLWSPSTVAENANLIAAAPELLEALQLIIKDLRIRAKVSGDIDDDGTVVLDIGSGALMKANDAISKALGQ
ncbi:hypothetical protein [Pantoea stewartii]|uniref:hypothetical protein n=1 Tax=Pantoea stewartii TaxID=66269 RepID=UPI00197FA6CA|nr:hypothetical protein [Pantoea stewartii]